MNRYQVILDLNAQEEAIEAAEYIAASSPANGAKWYAGFERAIESLAAFPSRCGRAREGDVLGVDLRQYVYHSHRIIFRIEEGAGVVRILHVRHAARRAIGESDEAD